MHLKWPPNIKRGTTETECKSKRERDRQRERGGEQDAGKRLLDHTESYEVGPAYVL